MFLSMNRIAKSVARGLVGLGLVAASSFEAAALTVQTLGVSPYETPTITCSGIGTVTVYAGISSLAVDGVPMNGFCIDPFHFSLPSSPDYQYVTLTSAPKGHNMSAGVALGIERLWGSYYSPGMSATAAAGLQIAIWELVGGSDFQLASANDYGAAGYIGAVTSPTYAGPVADLIALTGPGQDYVVQDVTVSEQGLAVENVPEGGITAVLLAGALGALIMLQRRFTRREIALRTRFAA
jgi:hypothetical protein